MITLGGSVWKVESRLVSPTSTMAVKLVHRKPGTKEKAATTQARVKSYVHLNTICFSIIEKRASLWSEYKILRQFKADPHPNIVAFTEFILTPSCTSFLSLKAL